MEITTAEALLSLTPTAKWVIRNDALTWLDAEQTQPTSDEIFAEIVRLRNIYNSKEYSRVRKAAYKLLNQDEMRYDDLVNGTTTWQDAIAAIKLAHPKP